MNSPVQVAVGVILDSQCNVLISKRHADSHQGGLWEFPGGKLQTNEKPTSALKRELAEELGILARAYNPFTRVLHHYSAKSVLLDVYLIAEFDGIPRGMEGQAIEWRSVAELDAADFPPANHRIIKLLQLPDCLAITPEFQSKQDLLNYVHGLLDRQLKLIQFRQNQLNSKHYLQWSRLIIQLCSQTDTKVIINNDLALFQKVQAGGYHANSTRLMGLKERPVDDEFLFSASCHNEAELIQAEQLSADMALLSPVKATTSHSSSVSLGWDGFAKLANSVSLPVFALGGLKESDLGCVRRNGGVGVAAIRGFGNPDIIQLIR